MAIAPEGACYSPAGPRSDPALSHRVMPGPWVEALDLPHPECCLFALPLIALTLLAVPGTIPVCTARE